MKIEKGYVITIIILLLMGILIAFYALATSKNIDDDIPSDNNPIIENPGNNTSTEYEALVVNNVDNFIFINNTWKNATDEQIESKKFNIYLNNNYLGNYYLKKGTVWNIFDDNKNYVDYEGDLLAATSGLNLKTTNFQKTVVSEELPQIRELVNYYVSENDLSVNEVINIDLDNNGEIDKIVNVSNIDAENEQQKYFNLVYILLNGQKIILINDTVLQKNILKAPIYIIDNIIFLNSESYATILIKEGYFSNAGKTHYSMYSYNHGVYANVDIK